MKWFWEHSEATTYRISNRGVPTRSDPPSWGLGEVLTTPPHKHDVTNISQALELGLFL